MALKFNFFRRDNNKKAVRKNLNLSDIWYFLSRKSSKKVEINTSEQALLKNSWVLACVRAIAVSSSTVPFKIINKKRERVEKIESYFRKPNDDMTGIELIEGSFAWMELRGFAVWEIEKPYIYLLDSDLVSREVRNGEVVNYLYYEGNGNLRKIPVENVVIFKNFNPFTRLMGLTPISALMKSLQMSEKSDNATMGILDEGAIIPGVLIKDGKLSDKEFERLQKMWRERYGGYDNAGKTPILEGGLRYEKIGLTPADMQFLNLEKMTVDRISTAFGVPNVLINKLEGVQWATAREQRRIFYENTIIPKLRRFEERVNIFVLPKFSKEAKFQFEYNEITALKEDSNKKAERERIYVSTGLRTINEIRKKDGLPPVPWGDDFWAPMSLVSFGKYQEQEKKLDQIMKELEDLKKKFSRGIGVRDREKYWRKFISRTTPQEERFKKELKKIFRKQEKEVLGILNKYKEKGFKKVDKDALDEILRELEGLAKKWNRSMGKKAIPFLRSFLQQAGDEIYREMGVELRYDVYDPFVSRWLKDKVVKMSIEVNKNTIEALKNNLIEGMEQGEGIDELSKRVSEVFDMADDFRAERIARTEIMGANNFASWDSAYNVSDGRFMKEWLTALDERTREWHAEANGQKVEMDDPFIVGGEELMHPGDPNGSAGNVINCRCTVIYSEKEGLNEEYENAIKGLENKIAFRKTEKGIFTDYKGRILFEKSGGKSSVSFNYDDVKKIIESEPHLSLHNHPSLMGEEATSIFSPADLRTFELFNVKEARVTGKYGTWVLKKPLQGWPKVDEYELQRKINEIDKKIVEELKRKYGVKTFEVYSKKEIFREYIDTWNQRLRELYKNELGLKCNYIRRTFMGKKEIEEQEGIESKGKAKVEMDDRRFFEIFIKGFKEIEKFLEKEEKKR